MKNIGEYASVAPYRLLLFCLTFAVSMQLDAQQSVQLLDIDAGHLPNDTGLDDQTLLSVVDYARLGGRALRVDFAPRDSFGNRNRGVQDWSEFRAFSFIADNPESQDIAISFVIRHSGTVNNRTRVNVDIVLHPGINFINLAIDEFRNVDGEIPDLSSISHWYLATGEAAPTLFFRDFILSKVDPTANQLASVLMEKLPNDIPLAGSYHITGMLDGERLDLIVEPEGDVVSTNSQSVQGRPHFSDPMRIARVRATPLPDFDRPVSFNTVEGDAIAAALEVYPEDNPINQIVSTWPVHENSTNIISTNQPEAPLRYNRDMAYIFVPADQARVEVNLTTYASSSDPGPYPLPNDTPIEGWPAMFNEGLNRFRGFTLRDVQRSGEGDRHAIVVDPVNRTLYEFANMYRTQSGWTATQASIFDLSSNALRPDGWTSSDAAGLPIYPLVVRFDELARGEIEHALRVTVPNTRRAYVAPATHYASTSDDPNRPRMGERLRLRANFDITGFSPEVQTILRALKKYGMLVADNGNPWAISVAPDLRIPDMHAELRRVRGSDFEVVSPPQ